MAAFRTNTQPGILLWGAGLPENTRRDLLTPATGHGPPNQGRCACSTVKIYSVDGGSCSLRLRTRSSLTETGAWTAFLGGERFEHTRHGRERLFRFSPAKQGLALSAQPVSPAGLV